MKRFKYGPSGCLAFVILIVLFVACSSKSELQKSQDAKDAHYKSNMKSIYEFSKANTEKLCRQLNN